MEIIPCKNSTVKKIIQIKRYFEKDKQNIQGETKIKEKIKNKC